MITKNNINVLDLFCGCGGFSQGFKESGFNVVAGIDIWDKAIETYKNNHNHLSLCKDLIEYDPKQLSEEYNIKKVDIIIGGPPCQGFSNAGKRDVSDPRNSLFMEFKKYIDYYNPDMFIMENVMGILSMKTKKGEKCIDIICDLLKKNYNINISKLYASDFEVPQNRRRVLIFGIRKDLKLFPYEPKYIIKEKLNRIPVSTILEKENDIDPSYLLSEKAITGIIKKKERMKKEGKGFGAQILKLDKPSYTIPARYWKDGYDALVKYSDNKIRRLTIVELARIQTFPDYYKFIGSKKDRIIQIGNAVACRFSYHIANHIYKMFLNIDN
tara:strand:- start:1849 stop:2829 length:981 start_codon:yes stop_codon:yes gene_type:complete